jgi:DNA-binding response OmpR family regulator
MPSTRLLVVSNDPSLSATREQVLSYGGHVVYPALSITEGLQYTRARQFDLVLIGHSVESEDRRLFLSQVREGFPHLPVIFICDFAGNGSEPLADVTASSAPEELLRTTHDVLNTPRTQL